MILDEEEEIGDPINYKTILVPKGNIDFNNVKSVMEKNY